MLGLAFRLIGAVTPSLPRLPFLAPEKAQPEGGRPLALPAPDAYEGPKYVPPYGGRRAEIGRAHV